MRVTVKYEDGHLVPQMAIRFRGKTFEIEVPDAEVADESTLPAEGGKAVENEGTASYTLSPDAKGYSERIRAELNAIRNAPLPPDGDVPEFTEKEDERLEAFSLREEMKKGHGRDSQ